MSDAPEKKKGVRLSPEEAWDMVATSHTGIFTSLKKDGTPVALPVWFALVDGAIWMSTPARAKKLARIRNNPRCSFLVESGERWRDLKAVHLTGTAEVVELSEDQAAAIKAVMDAKYDPFREPAKDMPASSKAAYSAMTYVRFTPDERIVSWHNARLIG